MRFEALLERQERGELSQMEAAELLGMSERTFRRYRDRYREDGADGLRDRRIGKPSSRRAAVEEVQRMLGLYREDYADFTVKHFHEQLTKRHNDRLGYTVTRLALHAAGLVEPAPRRSAHRRKRPRRPPRKSRRVSFDLPTIEKAEDLLPAFAAVVAAMGAGDLALDEAAAVVGVLEAKRKAIETVDIEKRLAALELRSASK